MDRKHKNKGWHVELIGQSIKSLKNFIFFLRLPVRWDDRSVMWLKTYLILKFRTGLRTVSAVLCSRRPGNKSAMNRHSADASRHSADASRHSAASVESSNHVDASLKTCVESLSAVRRLHKDLASHIEVCLLCCWVCRVCMTVLKVCRKSVTKVCWYNWRSAGFLG